jgi:hypothetical protein
MLVVHGRCGHPAPAAAADLSSYSLAALHGRRRASRQGKTRDQHGAVFIGFPGQTEEITQLMASRAFGRTRGGTVRTSCARATVLNRIFQEHVLSLDGAP